MTAELSTEVAPTIEELIAQLDPERDYGAGRPKGRTYEQVKRDILDGVLTIASGFNLPVLRERATNFPVKGTGAPIGTGTSGLQHTILAQFRAMAINDVPFAYGNLILGMQGGDPRYDKIFWEIAVGKVGEIRGSEGMIEAMAKLLERMQTPETRTITIDQAPNA